MKASFGRLGLVLLLFAVFPRDARANCGIIKAENQQYWTRSCGTLEDSQRLKSAWTTIRNPIDHKYYKLQVTLPDSFHCCRKHRDRESLQFTLESTSPGAEISFQEWNPDATLKAPLVQVKESTFHLQTDRYGGIFGVEHYWLSIHTVLTDLKVDPSNRLMLRGLNLYPNKTVKFNIYWYPDSMSTRGNMLSVPELVEAQGVEYY